MLPHMDAAYSFARYLARDPAAAEDIVQDAYLNALRGFDGWRGDSSKAWLLTIVRNCYLATLPGYRPDLAAEDVHEAGAASTPEEILIRRHDAALLRQEIGRLAAPFREVLVLRELEELSYKEIAAIVETPIGTVMSRLARARQMLGDRLKIVERVAGGEA
jgi:RNA polymerase sigma factor (sigma-70 family)